MAMRYAAYAALRDQGVRQWDAAAQSGLSRTSGERYERAYRRVHPELPPKRTDAFMAK
jgi:hypothetical protein